MPGLEELFNFGSLSKEITIGTHKVRLNALDARHVQDALNSSFGANDVAFSLDYKKQVLARAITHANGVKYIEDPANPTKEEIEKTLAILSKFHVTVINKLYEFYEQLDTEVKKSLEDEVKKS